MKKYKNIIDVFGIIVTIISIVVSIYVAIIAINADKELKKSTRRIETLTNKMDSAIERMEPLVQKIDTTTKSIADNLAKSNIKQEPANLPSGNNSTAKQAFEKGCRLLEESKYMAAIQQFKKSVREEKFKKSAYYNIAFAYAQLSKEDSTEQEKYRNLMVENLKIAARFGDEEARNLLLRYDENW